MVSSGPMKASAQGKRYSGQVQLRFLLSPVSEVHDIF